MSDSRKRKRNPDGHKNINPKNMDDPAGNKVTSVKPEENVLKGNKVFIFLGSILFLVLLMTIFSAVYVFKDPGDIKVQVPSAALNNSVELKGSLTINEEKEKEEEEKKANVLPPQCGVTNRDEKFDCHPERDPSEDRCLARGCCWSPTSPRKWNGEVELVGPPSCYYPLNYLGYQVDSIADTDSGLSARLIRLGPSGFPKDIQEVQIIVSFLGNENFNIKISDPNNLRYEVPYPKLAPEHKTRNQLDTVYDVVINLDGTMNVARKDTGITIFNANLQTMIFSDQLLQLNIKTPTPGFYGIGEAYDSLFRGQDWKRYVLFNRDNYPGDDLNLYGSHPFYMQKSPDGNYHGVLLFNSNGMDIVTQPTPGITFRPIGGVFDFYFFMGPTPKQVIQQYVNLIGLPFMPPYWSLGFHLCRYGYGTLTETRNIWQKNREAGVPFDVQWNDIDYMRARDDFTVDPVNFTSLGDFVEELHAVGMHYMMIMDVGVGGPDSKKIDGKAYQPYSDGQEMDCLVKNSTGDVLLGKVWNDISTVFPDFTHPRADDYMTKQYKYLYGQMKFDGSWIDMNEPSNFYSNGSLYGCPADSTLEHPPYIPGNMDKLQTKTLCMSAQHHASTHYNVHNLYGFTNMISTNAALKTVLQKRPFIISRSTFPGAGYYGGHWDGDIASSWEDFRWTIPSLLNFQMFGIPMIGADICGFRLSTTEELCTRWHALGAFYPFARNHNDIGTLAQDPASMGGMVLKSAITNLKMRYALLPFLYTLFYRSHKFGDTVARPLFFEFPEDPRTQDIDSTFLWGPSLLIIPVLYEGQEKVTAYIPSDTWYEVWTGKQLDETGRDVEFEAPFNGPINLLVRGGHILPVRQMHPDNSTTITTTQTRKNKFHLIVASKDGNASGELYWDDGDSLDFEEKFSLFKFTLADKQLTSTVSKANYKNSEELMLGSLAIYNAEEAKKITINDKEVPAKVTYSAIYKALHITELSQSLLENFTIKWK